MSMFTLNLIYCLILLLIRIEPVISATTTTTTTSTSNTGACTVTNCAKCDLVATICTDCKTGFTLSNGTCAPCGQNCLSCNTNGPGNCDSTSCNPGFTFLAITKQCIIVCTTITNCADCMANTARCTTCFTGSAINQTTGQCPACAQFCVGCKTAGPGKCDGCYSGYRVDTTTGTCQPCTVKYCLLCDSAATTCTYCQPGFIVSGGACVPCGPNCFWCINNGPGYCDSVSCNAGYTFNTATKNCDGLTAVSSLSLSATSSTPLLISTTSVSASPLSSSATSSTPLPTSTTSVSSSSSLSSATSSTPLPTSTTSVSPSSSISSSTKSSTPLPTSTTSVSSSSSSSSSSSLSSATSSTSLPTSTTSVSSSSSSLSSTTPSTPLPTSTTSVSSLSSSLSSATSSTPLPTSTTSVSSLSSSLSSATSSTPLPTSTTSVSSLSSISSSVTSSTPLPTSTTSVSSSSSSLSSATSSTPLPTSTTSVLKSVPTNLSLSTTISLISLSSSIQLLVPSPSVSPPVMTSVPLSATLSRNIGILAGGTKVRITIKFNDTVPSSDFIDIIIFDLIDVFVNQPNTISSVYLFLDIITPPAPSAAAGKVKVEFMDKHGNIWPSLTVNFEYKENPTVSKIYPSRHLTSGGTRVTIEGSNLDAAESSSLQLSVTVYRINQRVEPQQPTSADCFGIESANYPNYVNQGDKNLLCRMPRLNIPQEFIDKLTEEFENQTYDNSNITRKRRSADGGFEVDKIVIDNGDFAVIELKIITDAYSQPGNNRTEFSFIPSLIKIYEINSTIQFKSGNPDPLQIWGNHLETINLDNYIVSIGNGNCTLIQTTSTDNLIVCLPPHYKPQTQTAYNYTRICSGKSFDAEISINQEKLDGKFWHLGCAEYYDPFPILLVVLVTVLCGIFLIILTIALPCCCVIWRKKRRKKENKSSKYSSSNGVEMSSRISSTESKYNRILNPLNVSSIYENSRNRVYRNTIPEYSGSTRNTEVDLNYDRNFEEL